MKHAFALKHDFIEIFHSRVSVGLVGEEEKLGFQGQREIQVSQGHQGLMGNKVLKVPRVLRALLVLRDPQG